MFVSAEYLETIYDRLETTCPAVVGGPAQPFTLALPEFTIIRPVLDYCSNCIVPLETKETRASQAFFLDFGWKRVQYVVSTCPCCSRDFSCGWSFGKGPPRLATSVCCPEDAPWFQIVAQVKDTGLAFVQTKALWYVRSSIVRTKASFQASAEVLSDLHGPSSFSTEHDRQRFESAWLIFESLTLLWRHAPTVAESQTWHLQATHGQELLRADLTAVQPHLEETLLCEHFVEHTCPQCAAGSAFVDVKYGFTCRVCNYREGGMRSLDVFDKRSYTGIQCDVNFGCEEPPVQHCNYCRKHGEIASSSRAISPARILKHRLKEGVTQYKLDNESQWRSRDEGVPAESIRAYENELAEKSNRRRRRRQGPDDEPKAKESEDGNNCDQDFQDTPNPAFQVSATDVNPCGIDKCRAVPKRRYGGLLVVTLGCGRVVMAVPVAGGESLTQIYAALSEMVRACPGRIRFVFYDNACALARYARHSSRRHLTPLCSTMAELIFVLDSLHVNNHTACLDANHPLYMPEVVREQYVALHGVNSQTSEQCYSWLDRLCPSVGNMTPAVYRTFATIIAHLFNRMVLGGAQAMSRPLRVRQSARQSDTRTGSAGSQDCASEAQPPGGGDEPTPVPDSPPSLVFRRNPHGVGVWGAGKFHWIQEDSSLRPPCKRVWTRSLSQVLHVSREECSITKGLSYFLLHDSDRFELCSDCARAVLRTLPGANAGGVSNT